MIDIKKLLEDNGYSTYYGEDNWKHPEFQGELCVFSTKEALKSLAFKKGFENVNKYIKSLEEND